MKIVGDDPFYSDTFAFREPKIFFGFSSLHELTRYIQQLEKRDPQPSEGFKSGSEWCGTSTIEQAYTLALTGWPRGMQRAQEIAHMFEVEHATSRARHYSVAGASVSVGRMLAGNPDHMSTRKRRDGRRVITLYSELAVSAGVSAVVMAKRAVVVACICDVLESMGYACEIVAVSSITSDDVNGKRFEYIAATNLKQAGQALNLNDVVFGLGHPSMFRRFMFALCSSEEHLRSIWADQGYPARAFPRETDEFYLSAPTITEAEIIEKSTSDVATLTNLIIPKNLREILLTKDE